MPSSSNDSDNDEIVCQGFKLKGDIQMRDARDVMRYLLRKTPQGHGLVPVDKLHPVTKRKRQAPQPLIPKSFEHAEAAILEPTTDFTGPRSSKLLEADISQSQAQSHVESSDDEPPSKRPKNSNISTDDSADDSADDPSDTLTSEVESECPSNERFLCVSQYRGVYKPPKSSPEPHTGYRHWESDVESSVCESQPGDMILEGAEESSHPKANSEDIQSSAQPVVESLQNVD